MTALTKDNADIQKIVAFENAFERLLAIIYEEGQSDGGIVVSDCVNLMLNLLRGNASNQVCVPERRASSGPARLIVRARTGGWMPVRPFSARRAASRSWLRSSTCGQPALIRRRRSWSR